RIRIERAPKRVVEILRRPVRSRSRAIAHLQVVDAEIAGQFGRFVLERDANIVIRRHGSAVDAERSRNQHVAEEKTFDPRKRQNTGYRTILASDQVVSLVAQCATQDSLPPREMKKRAGRIGLYEAIPLLDIALCIRRYFDRTVGRAFAAAHA